MLCVCCVLFKRLALFFGLLSFYVASRGVIPQEDTSVKLFWEGSFLMAVEFYLAFQVRVCVLLWYGKVWCGVVWCGAFVFYGLVWFSIGFALRWRGGVR